MKAGKKQIQLCVVVAILLVVFNVVSFAPPFQRNSVFWLAWVFGNIAILAQVGIFYLAFRQGESATSRFYGFPIARVGVIYLAAQVVFSLILMAFSTSFALWLALILCVLLFAVAAIGTIATDVTRGEVVRQEVQLKAETKRMRGLQSLVASLTSQCHDEKAAKEVRRLSESLRYSDPVSCPETEQLESGLLDLLNDLKRAVIAENHELTLDLCRQAQEILAERNQLCKLNKGK